MVQKKKMKNLIFISMLIFSISFIESNACNDCDSFDGRRIKCGTFAPKELRQKRLEAKISEVNFYRPEMARQHISPSGVFKLHYDVAGLHAVPSEDKDKNGIPDYIDSAAYYFDYIYNLCIVELGYQSPFPDGGLGGSDHYDIYFLEIGNGLQGETFYGWADFEGEVLPRKKHKRQYSFIIMDNDYSPNDMTEISDGKKIPTYKTNGIMGLKVTAAHEFHHAIQGIYGIPSPDSPSIFEMTSVFFENRVFPESNDYLQYVNSLYRDFNKYVFTDPNPESGYRYGIYYHFLKEKFGDDIIRRHWELIEAGLYEYQSIDSALKERESSIVGSWNEFLAWVYHTGSRANASSNYIDKSDFPEITFSTVSNLNQLSGTDLSGQLLPLEIRPVRYIISKTIPTETPDTIDFLISDTYIEAAYYRNMTTSNFKLTLAPNEQFAKKACDYSYSLWTNRSISDTAFCSKGEQSQSLASAFPSPFKKRSDKYLFIPAPDKSLYGQVIEFQIFTTNQFQVYRGKQVVNVFRGNRTIQISPDELDLNHGVYLYRTFTGNDEAFGKFVVIE